ncbi:MAG: RNA 2',3'-cyclic phosphodiesterase [Candidatus Acidiferrum sp.]
MRLFIAIAIPSEIREKLAAFLNELRNIAPKVKWVRAENLHVTLKFLGHTDAAKLQQIVSALRTVRSGEPATLEFRGLGFFPNEKRPRVFWAGMNSSANLRPLAQDIDREMHPLGFELETRPFTPHLTLARFDPPGLPPNLGGAIKPDISRGFGEMSAREFHLIESKLKPTGAEYTTLQSFPFVAET